MSWFKIDDGFWAHPKILKLNADAIALWVRAGSWSSAQLTDGHVPDHVMPMFLATPDAVTALLTAGLWHTPGHSCPECADIAFADGYLFHDWYVYQRSREEVLADRAANAERQKRARNRAREKRNAERNDSTDAVSNGVSNGVTHGVSHADRNGPPDPTRPDPTITTSNEVVIENTPAPRARATRLSEPFIVTAAMREWAAKEAPGLDVDRATASFVDYWRGRAGKDAAKLDWIATWRNSIRGSFDRNQHMMARGQSAPARPGKSERAMSVVELGRQRDRGSLAVEA